MRLSRPFPWLVSGFRARIGREVRKGCALPQVTGLALARLKTVKVFEFMLLTSVTAGFEPALTAPEGIAVHRFDLVLCARRGPVGRVWGAENAGVAARRAAASVCILCAWRG